MHVDIQDYLNSGMTLEQAISTVLSDDSHRDGVTISIPKATYVIQKTDLFEKYTYITNHDHSLKSIFLYICDRKNVIIEGNGSEFIFVGRIVPVIVERSQNVTLKNFTVDYERPFFTQGKVLFADNETVRLEIDKKQYPYFVENETVHFCGRDFQETYIHQFTEFDPATKAQAYASKDNFFNGARVRAREISDGILEFYWTFRYVHKPGNYVIIKNDYRYTPGIFITESDSVTVKDVTVHQAGGMASVAQLSNDVTFDGFTIMPREGSGRLVSTNCDATHFTNCTGRVTLTNCRFESMLDDGTNVHGTYTEVRSIFDNCVDVTIGHHQQYGVCTYKPGDNVTFLTKDSLEPKLRLTVADVKMLNKNTVKLYFSEPPQGINAGDLVENPHRMPEVYIYHCKIGNNRGRGILLQTCKKIIAEHNEFYCGNAAVMINGDLNKWYESGRTTDVVICGNCFINAGYTAPLLAPGLINVICPRKKSDSHVQHVPYHGSVVVSGNTFETFDDVICCVDEADYFEFSGNDVIKTDKYAPFKAAPPDFTEKSGKYVVYTKHCRDVVVKQI